MPTVALIGIPLIHIESYRDGGPSCVPGATDKPRRDLEQLLKETPGVTIVDLGEITNPPNEKVYRNAPNFAEFCVKVEHIAALDDIDVILVLGGDHSAALPFYNLPGLVVRADVHGDAYLPRASSYWEVTGGNYISYVQEKGLKSADEVWNVGVQVFDTRRHDKGIFGQNLTMKEILESKSMPYVGFLDIDLDVLSIKYGLPFLYHSISDLKVEDLVQLATKLNPKIIGFFGCVDTDKNGYQLIHHDIISAFSDVFKPICKAIGGVAIARSLGSPQAYSAANH